MITLLTDRLVIRNFQAGDWEALHEMIVQYEASPYAAYDQPWPTSPDEIKGIAEWFAGGDHFLAVCFKESGCFIGFVALNPEQENPEDYNIGYVFNSSYHGKGYATEACRAVLDHGFNRLEARRVVTGTAAVNQPSRRLLERLGFQKMGESMTSFRTAADEKPLEFLGYTYTLTREEFISTPTSLAQEDIVEGLKRLGLERGIAVEVHSSLSSPGYVAGGAPTVIRALIEAVGEEGAIVMSAYPVTLPLPLTEDEKAKGIIAKVRLLDENADCKTGMGIIADTFRKWPGTYLGKSGHRVCAWGRNAELHSHGYEYLLSMDGWVLLLGVDIHRCSCMHQAESRIAWPQAITDYWQLPEELQRDYPETDWYVQYQDPLKPPLEDAWGKVQSEAERRGFIRRGRIGNAECLFFKANPVVNLYEELLRTDPFKLFGIERR